MKQFDDILKENVDKAFSSYNADHLADEGWNSFLAKRNGKRKAIILIFPLWAKAATIAILIGLGGLITYISVNHRSEKGTVISEAEKQPSTETPSIVNIPVTPPVSNIAAETYKIQKKTSPVPQVEKPREQVISEVPATPERSRNELSATIPETPQQQAIAENILPAGIDTVKREDENKVAELITEGPEKTEGEKTKTRSRGTTLLAGMSGVMAHVSDARGTKPGASVGIYLNQKITRRISFRPGLALAMSSLGFGNTASSPVMASAAFYAGDRSSDPSSFDGELSLVTMEIPLNVVFRVFERKNSAVFISAGASTMVYLSQHFTGDLMNMHTMDKVNALTGATYTETVYSSVNVDNSYGAFSRTDYFGLANLSAGYSIPFGKTSTLLIEPFVQFPLSRLTSLDLHVQYTGVSMKVGFGNKKE